VCRGECVVPGPPRKPGRAQGKRERPVLALVHDRGRLPEPPEGLLKRSQALWEAFWGSEVARAVDLDSDLYRLERWIRDVDEYERTLDEYRQERLVQGSMGQPRLNPLAARLKDLEAVIRETERDFGMTPMARLRLGIAVGQAALTAAEVNRLALENGDDAA
jgi:P27 family predicted phage terminase small subunit